QVRFLVADALDLVEQGQEAVASRGDVHIKQFPESGKVADRIKDIALRLGQRLHAEAPAGHLQQRLNKTDRQVGRHQRHVGTGELENEGVDKIRQELAAGRQVLRETDVRGGRQRVRLVAVRSEMGKHRAV